jgi:hypothetical protein
VIFWTEFSCWYKSYSVEVITTTKKRSSSWPGWPLPNIHISNANESLTLHVYFSVLYPCQELYPTCHIWVTQRVHTNQELLFLRKHFSSFPVLMVGSMLLIFFILFCVVLLYVFPFCVLMSVTISPLKWCSVRLYLQLFVGGLISYLRYLCLFSHSDIRHALCCVFVLFLFVVSVLCSRYLWIVHFWFSLRYSLTSIKQNEGHRERKKIKYKLCLV